MTTGNDYALDDIKAAIDAGRERLATIDKQVAALLDEKAQIEKAIGLAPGKGGTKNGAVRHRSKRALPYGYLGDAVHEALASFRVGDRISPAQVRAQMPKPSTGRKPTEEQVRHTLYKAARKGICELLNPGKHGPKVFVLVQKPKTG